MPHQKKHHHKKASKKAPAETPVQLELLQKSPKHNDPKIKKNGIEDKQNMQNDPEVERSRQKDKQDRNPPLVKWINNPKKMYINLNIKVFKGIHGFVIAELVKLI